MIPKLVAIQFVRFMESGRTSPALFGCEDESGRSVGEYVVKLRGTVGEAGLMKELFASNIARYFNLLPPPPALIVIEQPLADLVAHAVPAQAAVIEGSVGLNFGSLVQTGVSTWPVDKSIPAAMLQGATDVFAFDALVQNPDRRHSNPNLLTRGDSFIVFDHEMAFSFLLALLPSANPWSLDDQRYLLEHVFFRALKSKAIDVTFFTNSLVGLTDALLSELAAEVPSEWNNESVPKIKEHLCVMRDHAGEFAESLRRFLV
jgi:hypothetical protein